MKPEIILLMVFGFLVVFVGVPVGGYYLYKYLTKTDEDTDDDDTSSNEKSDNIKPPSGTTTKPPSGSSLKTSDIVNSPEYQRVLDARDAYVYQTSSGFTDAEEQTLYTALSTAVDDLIKVQTSGPENESARSILSSTAQNRDKVKQLNRINTVYENYVNQFNSLKSETKPENVLFRYKNFENISAEVKTTDGYKTKAYIMSDVIGKDQEANQIFLKAKADLGRTSASETPPENATYCKKYMTDTPLTVDYTGCNTDNRCVIAKSPFGAYKCHAYNDIMIGIDFGLTTDKDLRNTTPGLYPPVKT